MPAPVSFAEIVGTGISSSVEGLHTAMPGIVKSYYPATQTADVQPAVKRPIVDAEGATTYEDLPVLPNVPVQFPRGKGFVVAFPLEPGDEVLVVFSEVSTSEFRTTGQVSEPIDVRRHGMGNAVAIPCVTSDPNVMLPPAVTFASSSLVVGKETGPALLVMGTDVAFGPAPTSPVALSLSTVAALNAVAASLTALGTALTALGPSPVTGVQVGGAVTSAASSLTAALAPLTALIPSTLVRAQ